MSLTFRRLILLIILLILLQLVIFCVYFNFSFENVHTYLKPKEFVNKNVTSAVVEARENLSCQVTDKQIKSALSRIKTSKCHQKVFDTYCLIKNNKPWMKTIKGRCPNSDGFQFGQSLACFPHGEYDLQSFNGKNKVVFSDTHKDRCLHSCLQFDHKYAARFYNDCICTDEIFENSTSLINCDSNCFQNCSNRKVLYSTGLEKSPYYFPNLSVIDQQEHYRKPRILFLLIVSGRSHLQVLRLLKNIYSDHHFYFIHVDSRNNYLFNKLHQHLLARLSNIKFSRQRFASIWGGTSLLTTILSCFHEIFSIHSMEKWDFVINLSETDFPIKPIADFEKYLAANYGKNFVKSHGKSTFNFIQTQALNKVFVECEQHMWRIYNRNLIQGIVWDGGSDWFILSRNFTHYVTFGNDELLNNLKLYFQYALLPAESFFHVVLRNSEYCTTIVNNNLKATNWNRKKGCKCQHKHIVDWCGCSPNAFRTKDTARLTSTLTKALFFARKFEHTVDSEIINYVERRLLLNGLQRQTHLEDLFFINTYSSQIDSQHALTDSKLEFYRNLMRKSMSTAQCWPQADHLVKLFESNVLFRNGAFYGTILKYKQDSWDFEIVIRRFENDTTLVPYSSKPKLKTIQVCTNYDLKEERFLGFECLLEPNSTFQVLHEWELFFGLYPATFVILDPQNRIHSEHEVILNNTHTSDITVKLLFEFVPTNLKPGIWKLLVMREEAIIAAHRFMILGSTGPSNKPTNGIPHLEDVVGVFIDKNHDFFFPTETIWFIDQACHNGDIAADCKLAHCANVSWSLDNISKRYTF